MKINVNDYSTEPHSIKSCSRKLPWPLDLFLAPCEGNIKLFYETLTIGSPNHCTVSEGMVHVPVSDAAPKGLIQGSECLDLVPVPTTQQSSLVAVPIIVLSL